MHRNVKKWTVLLVAVATILVVTQASNLATFVTCRLRVTPAQSGLPAATINLPYRQSMTDADDLIRDIDPTLASVSNVQKFDFTNGQIDFYTGRKGSPPAFPLVPGECYFAQMQTEVDYSIEGAHDPSFVHNLDPTQPNSGSTFFIGLPPHIVARDSQELMEDIGFENVANVQRWDIESASIQIYTGRKGSAPAFPIDCCECYFVQMISPVQYIPTHY